MNTATNANHSAPLGMILKGYPRISESFISTEILLLESLGTPIEIYSLRRPRENFAHASVEKVRAPVTYLPEYVLPNLATLLKSNYLAWRKLGSHYPACFCGALRRAGERRTTATIRHFLQAGHLSALRLLGRPVPHIHAHFCHTPASVAFFAAELTGLPFSITAHAKDIYTSDPDQLARKIHRARFVVTCTNYNAHYLARLNTLVENGGRPTPIHTIYHGIDLDFFKWSHRPDPAPPYKILSIGRHVAKKGYDDLFRAAKLLNAAGLDFELVQIGSGELTRELEAMVYDLGLGHRIKLLGTLPHETVIEHYRSSHCFALACKVAANGDRDGIPNVLVEAMAVGLPVIATNVSAIPELVADGATGKLVEAQAPAAMARAILDVLLNPDAYERQRKQARLKVETDFDNKACIMKLHQLFQQALAAP